ncbi:MAG: hypothetical protein IJN85_04800 [Oscillospiraceae bacterium]|nr:hypothetical protein [Oscillospiraceae bacterium]
MKIVKALFTGFDLIEGKEYEVIHEYDTVYEIKLKENCYICRDKTFFEIAAVFEDVSDFDFADALPF